MKKFNIFKLVILILFVFNTGLSFGQKVASPQLIEKSKVFKPVHINNESILMPASPLGMAFFVFMLIITLAFSITRLKDENFSN